MVVDQPLIVYSKTKKEAKHSKKQMDDAYEKWAARKKGKTLKGQQISLGEYLKGNV